MKRNYYSKLTVAEKERIAFAIESYDRNGKDFSALASRLELPMSTLHVWRGYLVRDGYLTFPPKPEILIEPLPPMEEIRSTLDALAVVDLAEPVRVKLPTGELAWLWITVDGD
jgi:hypothetical protein